METLTPMTDPRPKLVIVGGTGVPAHELSAALGDRYQIVYGAQDQSTLESAWALTVLEATGDAVCLAKPDGQVLWSNSHFRALDDVTKGKVVELTSEALRILSTTPRTDSSVANALRQFASPDQCRFFEVSITAAVDPKAEERRAAGPPSAPTPSPTKRVFDYAAVIVRDITKAHRQRQKMDAIDKAGSELIRIEADSVRRMNSVERLKFMEAKIVGYAHDLLHFDHFGIRLLDVRTGKLELVLSHGLPPSYAEFDIYPLAEGNGISGAVAASGNSYICDDAATDPLFLPGLSGARSSLTVPLRLQDNVIGVLNVESQQPRAFGPEDRQFAEIFARSIAVALHILDLLVVERSTVNKSITGRVEGELNEPLADISHEIDALLRSAPQDPETAGHIARIRADVDAIRSRVRDVALGPTTLLGVERALADKTIDPVMKGRRVLVADDEAKIRRIIGDVLRNRGCEMTVCDSGATAIDAIIRATEQGIRFDLIVSDIKMPDRNGYEVFAAVRRLMGQVPVILMTGFGYDPHHSIVRASQEGLQAVLFKPFPVERLVDEARKALTPAPPMG